MARDVGLASKHQGDRRIFKESSPQSWQIKPLQVPYTLEDMAADAFAVLDAASISSAHIVGVSMGGVHRSELWRSLTPNDWNQ